MEECVLEEVEKYLDGEYGELPYSTGDSIGRSEDYSAGRNRYIGYLISLSKYSYKGIKVGLDCANGSTWMIAKSVFDALGADTYVIGNRPNGLNINVDCGSTHISALQSFVRENSLSVGFAFDGDADRCLAVDENGRCVNGDEIMYLCARHMKEHNRLDTNTVVTTVMSNFGLYKALDDVGIKYEKTAVGDKYVWENMRANGHLIGGEQSGHIIFSKYATTGDGLITAIKIMQVLIESRLPLSKLSAPVPIYPQVLKNVIVDDKDGTMADETVMAAVAETERTLGESGRILLRKSGTEPVLRVMAEALSDEDCERSVDAIIESMRISGHLVRAK
jgi:phosphoglucosamine mutase